MSVRSDGVFAAAVILGLMGELLFHQSTVISNSNVALIEQQTVRASLTFNIHFSEKQFSKGHQRLAL